MSKTNCINCGSAKDINEIKCPFCGTTYLNLTGIDFTSNEPVVCEFVLPNTKERTVMSMLAIPHLDRMNATPNVVCCEADGNRFASRMAMATGWDIEFGISMTPVERDGKVIQIRKGGDGK